MAERLLLETPRFRVVQTDGRQGPAKAIIRHPGSVCIVPLLDDGRVCLIRNFRVTAGRRLLEIPAGTLEPGEPPDQAAVRELAEETGFQAGRCEKIGEFFLAPGILDERARLYLASQLAPGPQRLEADEQIEICPLSWPEIQLRIRSGEIEDAKTLAGLFHWRSREQATL
jgi:ADP-ribose pyrophosphatase